MNFYAGQLPPLDAPTGLSVTPRPAGNRVRTVDPAGHTTILGYDLAGRMVNATDALGGVTRFQYDSEDRLTGREDAAGLAQSYGYTPTGELAETVDAAGTTRMVYAAQGAGCASCSGASGDKPVRIEYPTFTRTLAYDQRGRKVRETDTSTTQTRGQDFVYDKAGRLLETRQWAHDPDLVQSSTKYTYDLLGRMTCMTDASGGQTRYDYDVWDNLKTLTDPKDQSTQFVHDALGRVTVETRPLGGQTTYAYTLAGQLRKRTDARGVRTEYAYDALGRVSAVSSYAPGQIEPGRVVSLGYDRLGRLISYTDGQTSGLLAYDALGRKTAETVNYGPFSRTNTYTWAANGQLSGFTGPDGQAQTFAYDTAGRLTAIGIGSHMATIDAYTWTAPGSITLPGGVKRTYGHDGFLRLIAQNATDPADNPILNHAYQYNDRGNMARKVTEHGDYAYAYDILDRLITSQNPGLSDESFTYDKVGNRLSAGDTSGPWSYNANNELQGFDGAQYRYDDHGNLIEKTQPGKTLTFAYDLDNRLSEVKENAAALATYGYDPFGRRIWKEVHGQRTYYHYSDQGLIAELDATGTLIKSYGYKPGSPWGTDPLYVRQGGRNYWYLTDHLGTPQQIVAENGAVVWQAQYAVFGKAEVDAGSTLTNNLRFPGQYYDAETGLHYNWNRYYDPEVGRYTQTDPIGFEGGDVNLYGYVGENPVNWMDFNGLEIIGRWITRPSINPWTLWVGVDMRQFEYNYWAGSEIGKIRFGYAPLHIMSNVRFHIECKDTCSEEIWDIKMERYFSESFGKVPIQLNVQPLVVKLLKILGWEIEHSGQIEYAIDFALNELVGRAMQGWGILNKTPDQICKISREMQ